MKKEESSLKITAPKTRPRPRDEKQMIEFSGGPSDSRPQLITFPKRKK